MILKSLKLPYFKKYRLWFFFLYNLLPSMEVVWR